MIRRIVRAAILDDDGNVWDVPQPGRHHHIIRIMRESGYKGRLSGHERQGFLLDDGTFITRDEGMAVAEAAGQLLGGKAIASVLTSEDLW